MYTVVVAVDERTERSLAAVDALSKWPGDPADVRAVVLNVYEEFDVTDEGGRVTSEEYFDSEDVPESVTATVERLESAGFRVETRREHGDPADRILEVAAEEDAAQVVVGGKRRSPVGKALFGSVTQSVVLGSDRPVIVVPTP